LTYLRSSIVFEKYVCEDTRTSRKDGHSTTSLFAISRAQERQRMYKGYHSIANVSSVKTQEKKEEEEQEEVR